MVSGSRSVVAVVAGVLGLIALAIVIVVVAGGRQPRTFPASSPEAALQAYLTAWDAGNYEASYAAFSSGAQQRMSFEEYERYAGDYRFNTSPGTQRLVVIDRTSADGDHMTVHLIVEETYGDGFGGGGPYRSERAVQMVNEDGAWRLADPLVWLEPAEHFKTF